MKKIILIFSFLSFCLITTYAQFQPEKGILMISEYEGNAALSITDNKLKVQKADDVGSFDLKGKEDSGFTLKKSADSTAVFKILQINSEQVRPLLNVDNSSKKTMTMLLHLINQMPGKKILLQSDEATTTTNQPTGGEEEGGKPITEDFTQQDSSPSSFIIGLIGLVLGFIIGLLLKKRKSNTRPKEGKVVLKPATHSDTHDIENPASLRRELEELKTLLQNSKRENHELKEKTQKMLDGDILYFNAVFEKIILPFEKALNSGDAALANQLALMAINHFSSISRMKIRKKQNFDEDNIQKMVNNAYAEIQKYPVIEKSTPEDNIPAHLRTLINILKQNGIDGLEDTLIAGYRIKNMK